MENKANGSPGTSRVIRLEVNGEEITELAQPVWLGSQVVAAVNPVAKALGASVAWDEGTQTLTVVGPPTGQLPPRPWPYRELDPEVVRKRGYDECQRLNNCMYGAGAALVLTLREVVGYPWTVFPLEAFLYGAGGVAGLGTICGALNASGLVMSLVMDPTTLPPACFGPIRELVTWYSITPLPTNKHEAYCRFKNQEPTVAGSPLCSMSLFNWGMATMEPIFGEPQRDRCSKLVGDTAAKAAELLNATLVNAR